MALASHCAAQLHLGLQRWSSTATSAVPTTAAFRVGPKLSPIPILSKSRSDAAARLQIKRKLSIVYASGEKEKRPDDAPQPQGPPLLTILAGLAVFLIVFWIAKSIILGLIGFLVSLIPSK